MIDPWRDQLALFDVLPEAPKAAPSSIEPFHPLTVTRCWRRVTNREAAVAMREPDDSWRASYCGDRYPIHTIRAFPDLLFRWRFGELEVARFPADFEAVLSEGQLRWLAGLAGW